MTEITVNTKSKSYPVFVENGLAGKAGSIITDAGLRFGKAALITDDIVDSLYADTVKESLEECGIETVKYVLANGEESKNAANFINLLEFLAANRFHRNDAVIALGAVIRGATPHADLINSQVSKSLAQVSIARGVPVVNGVICADNIEQAVERAGTKAGNKGWDGAQAAMEMASLYRQLG